MDPGLCPPKGLLGPPTPPTSHYLLSLAKNIRMLPISLWGLVWGGRQPRPAQKRRLLGQGRVPRDLGPGPIKALGGASGGDLRPVPVEDRKSGVTLMFGRPRTGQGVGFPDPGEGSAHPGSEEGQGRGWLLCPKPGTLEASMDPPPAAQSGVLEGTSPSHPRQLS